MLDLTKKLEPLIFEIRGLSIPINTNYRDCVKALEYVSVDNHVFLSLLGIEIIELAEFLKVEEELTDKEINDEIMRLYNFISKELYGIKEEEDIMIPEEKMLDFKQDAKIIIPSFMACYRLDLVSVEFLDFRMFSAYLSQLTNTAMNDVWEIRAMKVPEATNGNEEYREQVIRAKEQVRIKEEVKEDLKSDLAHLFN